VLSLFPPTPTRNLAAIPILSSSAYVNLVHKNLVWQPQVSPLFGCSFTQGKRDAVAKEIEKKGTTPGKNKTARKGHPPILGTRVDNGDMD